MDSLNFSLVISAAIFHATWNFFAKKSQGHKISLLWLAQLLTGLLILPLAIIVLPEPKLTPKVIGFIAGTSFIHGIYICLLGKAYQIGEISSVYPVMRGSGIVGTALIASVLGIDSLSSFGIAGVALVIFGSFFVGMKELPSSKTRAPMLIAIIVGLTISLYSIVDKLAVDSMHPFFYVAAMNLFSPLFVAPFVLKVYKKEIKSTLLNSWKESLGIGMAGLFTYLLILFAFKNSQTTYVVALRESSIIFAAMLGLFLLKESVSKRKVLGIFLIALGAVVIKLA